MQVVRSNGHLVIQFDGAAGKLKTPSPFPHSCPRLCHKAEGSNQHQEIIVSDRRLTVPLPHRLARVRRLLSHADRQARKVERMETARDVEKNCQAWPMWTKYNIVVQIDSGT